MYLRDGRIFCGGQGASPPPRTKTRVYQKQHNDPAFDLRGELYRIVGVDLTDIPGINELTAHTIISEIGTDVSRFRNASAFASWLGLCPEKQVSGGKVLYTHTRPSLIAYHFNVPCSSSASG